MKKNSYIALAVVGSAMLMQSCANDIETSNTSGEKKNITFIATQESGDDATRTSLSNGSSIIWNSGDAISIFDAENNNAFTIDGEGGSTSASFSGAANISSIYYAVYPYIKDATIEGGKISGLVLPAEQTATKGGFDPKASLMTATSTGDALSFKNLCAYAKITTTEACSKITFKGGNSEKIAGTFSATLSADGTVASSEFTSGATEISLVPASGSTTFEAGTYYIALMPQTLQGLTVTCKTESTALTRNIANTTTVTAFNTRNRIVDLGTANTENGWTKETKKVEGTVTINGTTYNKAVGGTVADYVDLGITVKGKKVLWATHNLGASKPEEYGAYIAWGDKGVSEEGYSDGIKLKSGSSYYDWDNNAYNGTSSCEGYNKYTIADGQTSGSWYTDGTFKGDNKTTLESEDDAATVNWGSDWRTPTYDEWTALNNTNNFTWTWDATNNGYTVTSKISGYKGKSIFLPAAGYCDGSVYDTGFYGLYWSSSLNPDGSDYARFCLFDSGLHSTGFYGSRCYGFSVRPVRVQN